MATPMTLQPPTDAAPECDPALNPDCVPDAVEKASEESFPASDPPSWVHKPDPKDTTAGEGYPQMTLKARKAIDFMTTNLVSIREDATLLEASVLLTDKGLNAVPVIDAAGKPVGVISQSDLLIHARENLQALAANLGQGAKDSPLALVAEPEAKREAVQVRDLMTPAVFAVPTEAPARQVIEELLSMNVHQMFVVDETGVLVAFVSALDVIKHLQFEDGKAIH